MTGPSHGTASVDTAGNIIYVPNPNYNGTDSFTYVLCDNGIPAPTLCDTATVFITILPVNDPPVAMNDSVRTPEDSTVVIIALNNDHDPDGDSTITNPVILGGPYHGSATVDSSGAVIYTPNPNYNGFDTIKYVICDGGEPPLCDTATIFIYVSGINNPPVAGNDSLTIPEDSTGIIRILLNDHDIDGDSTIGRPVILTGPSHGTATVNPDGSVTYVPDPNYSGTDTFTYIICDNGNPSGCDTATVYIHITSVEDLPVIVVTPITLYEGDTITSCMPYTLDPLTPLSSMSVSLCGNDTSYGVYSVVLDTVNNLICVTYDAHIIPGNDNSYDSLCISLCDTVTGKCVTVQVPVTILPKTNIVWVKGFSPNGDGTNDFYLVPAADIYPDNSMKVFNRWGDEVWFSNGAYNNSTNNWKGTNNSGTPLPDGTYYFVFDYKDMKGKQQSVVKYVVVDRGE